jgi:hypothetical protein
MSETKSWLNSQQNHRDSCAVRMRSVTEQRRRKLFPLTKTEKTQDRTCETIHAIGMDKSQHRAEQKPHEETTGDTKVTLK